jgi:hypothetical protein
MNRIVLMIVALGLPSVSAVLGWAEEPSAEQARAIAEESSLYKPAIKTDVHQELAELKQLVSGISARLDRIEERLSQLEERTRLPGELKTRIRLPGEPTTKTQPVAKPTTKMRPLGNHLMVDEFGNIWEGEKRVGLWGVPGNEVPAR